MLTRELLAYSMVRKYWTSLQYISYLKRALLTVSFDYSLDTKLCERCDVGYILCSAFLFGLMTKYLSISWSQKL